MSEVQLRVIDYCPYVVKYGNHGTGCVSKNPTVFEEPGLS